MYSKKYILVIKEVIYLAKRYYYIEDELFNEFKKAHPDLWERGTTYCGAGFETIRIRIPSKGCLLYNRFKNSVTWVDHYGDKEYEKAQCMKRRENMYELFVEAVRNYQEETGDTQGVISEKTGISRRKINEYLNGKAFPKLITIQRICASLGIDISELERRNHVE